MNFLLTRLFSILTFSVVIKINGVYGVWNWTPDNMVCIKGYFNGYVESMEKIFSPKGLGNKSLHQKIVDINLKTITEAGDFIEKVGPLIERVKNHLNHETVTADRTNSSNARGVLLKLCQLARSYCSQVAYPMPLSDILHATYILLHGTEDDYTKNCGEYITKTAESDEGSYVKTEKKSSKGFGISKRWSLRR